MAWRSLAVAAMARAPGGAERDGRTAGSGQGSGCGGESEVGDNIGGGVGWAATAMWVTAAASCISRCSSSINSMISIMHPSSASSSFSIPWISCCLHTLFMHVMQHSISTTFPICLWWNLHLFWRPFTELSISSIRAFFAVPHSPLHGPCIIFDFGPNDSA